MVGVIVREDDDGYQGGMDERMRVEDFDFDVQGGEDVGGDEIGRRDERVDKEVSFGDSRFFTLLPQKL